MRLIQPLKSTADLPITISRDTDRVLWWYLDHLDSVVNVGNATAALLARASVAAAPMDGVIWTMQGYKTNYVNLIADNLRDRYENGFPILKELIQNADDAKAHTLIFGKHPGFPGVPHPLLKGPGLWFFNDGEFKQSDVEALRSFGINSKAGDASAIGKFGLGMKSVFHLCEALFYVAWDGKKLHSEGLTPWKQDDQTPHPEWDESSEANRDCLVELARCLVTHENRSWFLLWLPLRKREHLKTLEGQESGAIISRFPGDDPSHELAFLNDTKLAHDVAEMLPLLRHLERVEHKDDINPFVLQLTDATRPMGTPPCEKAEGQILLDGKRLLLSYSGRRIENPDADGWFAGMKGREEWPRTWYRDELGREHQAMDKTSPEAAVLFCSGPGGELNSRLHWAVFLPVEDGGERLRVDREGCGHSLVLHGQFFLDAGRRKIHGLEHLHREPEEIGDERIDESTLRRAWNQRLAQKVVLPLVLPALEHYAEQQKLSEEDCTSLTRALSGSRWFHDFRAHICRERFWIRILQPEAEPQWRLVEGDSRFWLRPLPTPPRSAPDRPWRVFPELADCEVLPYDLNAPRLWDGHRQWQEAELDRLLSKIGGLFTDGPSMDYLADFLDDSCAGPYVRTERVQRRLLGALRVGLRAAGAEARRRVALKARRLIAFVEPQRRLALPVDLPEAILRELWAIDVPLLLIPKAMEPECPGSASPDKGTLTAWLGVLDSALGHEGTHPEQKAILGAVQGLLQTLSAEARGRFLRENRRLRVIGARDAQTKGEKAVSCEDLERVIESGTLFAFAEGLRGAEMGLAPLLARALPDAEIFLVRTKTYHEIFPDDRFPGTSGRIPAANDGRACLAAVGLESGGRLGGLADRRKLLESVGDPGSDANALRGLRFLLHGSPEHQADDAATLWIGRHGQHPAWNRLWNAIHPGEQWSLVPDKLADTVLRAYWTRAKIVEIDSSTLIDELERTGKGIEAPEEFSIQERDEILSRIERQDLWLRLPLHTTLDGKPVSANQDRVYLMVRSGLEDDPLTGEAILIAPSANALVAEKQNRWLRSLDDRARIEIALGTAQPFCHWRTVMDALGRLQGDINEDMRALLRRMAWLPSADGKPTRPADVIDLKEALGDETYRLIAEHRQTRGPCFAVPAEIDAAVLAHHAWRYLRELGFSSGRDGLERLGLLLKDLPRYHIGPWPVQPDSDLLRLLARCDALPGWSLLELASAEPFDPETVWDRLGAALSKPVDFRRVVETLEWLSEDTADWRICKTAFDAYLSQLIGHGKVASALVSRLRLASADGRWRDACELCAGAHGVVAASLLDETQTSILGNLIQRAGTGGAGRRADEGRAPNARFQLARRSSSNILREYFREWDTSLVPAPMIGVMLGLLGLDVRDLANEYLHPHSFEWLLEQLPWNDPGETPERREWMGGIIVSVALDLIEVGVQVEAGNEVETHNLLGQPIRVALEQDVRTLLAGALNWQGGYGVMIPLRRIETGRFHADQLGELLRATAERLYTDLYNQEGVDFGPLWRELDRSNQLEIGIARRLILDHIPFYLRQFSVKSESLKKQLEASDTWGRRIAEAEADGQSAESSRKELHKALEDLAGSIDQNIDAQQAVVQAFKSKLQQYQYDVSSIPLELFQNADDAIVELGKFRAYPLDGCEVPPGARRFVVEAKEDALRFMHWGRPINARGPVGFNGERRGFDRDLEKMLILSASDKHGEAGVTGKFGLGFKSVLLACEQPRILSGRLAIRVVAGILPQIWDEAQEARRRLSVLSAESRLPGTLIELPGVAGGLRDQVLERFRQVAGIFCVFGRAIRSIACTAETESTWNWRPSQVCPGVEVGRLDLQGDWGAQTMALCIRTESGDLLVVLGPQGFRPLPEWIPALWVTVPTREQSSVGFAINGSFDLDIGRARLAGSTTDNMDKARRIGSEAGHSLGALLECSREDWQAVRPVLGLAADLDAVDFWESIWFGLTKGWLGHRRSDGAELVRELVLTALIRLSEHPHAIPNGLKGSLQGFSDVKEIRYELNGVLLKDDVAEVLAGWDRFAARYPKQKCVSEQIGAIVRHAKLANLQPLNLSALVGMLDRARVEPADAEFLGRVRFLTEDAAIWEEEDLKNRLIYLLFQSETKQWITARELLISDGPGLDRDESRLYPLAPLERRLHGGYYNGLDSGLPAVAFFLTCRQRLEVRVEDIAVWVLDADSVEMRRTALKYIADGDRGERVAERVRGEGWLHSALQNSVLTEGLSAEQQDRLRRRLVSVAELERAVCAEEAYQKDETIQAGVDLRTALERLREWWSQEGSQEAEDYRRRLYPQALNLRQDPETGRIDRSSWFMLFALGSFQGMGRTREDHHRSFIQFCQQKGWWNTFAEIDPKEQPEQWMNIIEEYAEDQHEDEQWAQWIAQFPKLYRLSRWLDDYIDTFLSIDRFQEGFSLDAILAPRANPVFQGSDIDAPPLTRTLKLGAHLVVRELLHHGVITNQLAVPHAYAPIERVKKFFSAFGVGVDTAEDIYNLLKEHLGDEGATFSEDYDIPLRIISLDDSQSRLLFSRDGGPGMS